MERKKKVEYHNLFFKQWILSGTFSSFLNQFLLSLWSFVQYYYFGLTLNAAFLQVLTGRTFPWHQGMRNVPQLVMHVYLLTKIVMSLKPSSVFFLQDNRHKQQWYNISLSRHEQVFIMRLHFERYFFHHIVNTEQTREALLFLHIISFRVFLGFP